MIPTYTKLGNKILRQKLQCRIFHLNATLITTHKQIHTQTDETSGNTEFSTPCVAVAADALVEIGTAITSAVMSPDKHVSQNKSLVLSGQNAHGQILDEQQQTFWNLSNVRE